MPTVISRKEGDAIRSAPNPQSQSALFRLPPELRLRIFALVVGCPGIPLAVIESPNRKQLKLVIPKIGGRIEPAIRAQRLLSLPLTCARAHAEAMPLLYGTNTFIIGDPDVFSVFARGAYAPWVRRLDFCWIRSTTPPVHAHLKRKKRLRGLFGKSPKKEKLEELWNAIASFEALRWIRIEIYLPPPLANRWKLREEELLSPLKGLLKEKTKGELILTWEKAGTPGKNVEDFLLGWSIKRRPWGPPRTSFASP